jgi:hypothetical protein
MLEQRIVRGQVAQIRWAYYVAAGIEGFTLLQLVPPGGKVRAGIRPKWSLVGRVVGSDKFKMAQRPLLFVAPFGRGRSVWQIEQFRIEADRIVATLGPREDY